MTGPLYFSVPTLYMLTKFIIVGVLIYIFLMIIIYGIIYYLNPSFTNPLHQFIPSSAVDHPRIQHELHLYNRWSKFMLCHGLSSAVAQGCLVAYYGLAYPILINFSTMKPVWALKINYTLQQDKLDHFKSCFEAKDYKLYQDFITGTKLQHIDLFQIYDSLPRPEIKTSSLLTMIIFFSTLFIGGLIFYKYRSRFPSLFFVPKLDNETGWLVLKIVYPTVLMVIVITLVYRWHKSQLSFTDYLSHQLMGVDPSIDHIIQVLRRIRYYLLAGSVAAWITSITNWIILVLSFPSYRFSSAGVDELRLARPELDQLRLKIQSLPDEYHHLLPKLDELITEYDQRLEVSTVIEQVYAQFYMADGTDVIGELWWLPIIRRLINFIVITGFVSCCYINRTINKSIRLMVPVLFVDLISLDLVWLCLIILWLIVKLFIDRYWLGGGPLV